MASVYRRGKQLWGRVQRQGRELRQPLKTTVKSVAQRRLGEWLQELDRVAWGDKPRRSFDEAMVKFIQEHLPTLKPRSSQRYMISIAHLTEAFEGKGLDELGTAEFSEFETTRRGAGARAPTIRRDFACLSSMFSCCIDWEWVETNPVGPYLRRRKKRGLKESPPRRRYLTPDEERAVLAAASAKVAQAIAFAIDTGLRKEEQFSLRRDRVRGGRVVLDNGTKNSKPREVPLLPRAAEIVARLPVHLASDYLFVNENKRAPTVRRKRAGRFWTMDRGLKAACRRAGVADVRWHDLRRTCGHRLLKLHKMSMEQVSKWLGHSSIAVTEKIYAFLEVEDLEQQLADNRRREARPRRKGAGTKAGTGVSG
jgi:integrase